MKNSVIFILSFFVYSPVFAQDMMEKRYFENHPEMGGDVRIKSSSVKVEKDEIFKTFEIESPEDGVYYMDAWIVAPVTKEGYPEYKVAVNGVLSEFTFKPQSDGWHSLPLTDAKKSVTAIPLKKGKNNISIIGKRPEIPNIEIIKLSSDISKTGIPDTNYKKFVESIKSNTLKAANNTNAVQAASGSPSGTAGEIYDYYLNTAARYTTYQTVYLSAGDLINITVDNPSSLFFPYRIELFSMTDPVSCLDPDYFMTDWVVAPVTGIYFLLIQAVNPFSSGWVHLGIHTYNQFSFVHENHYTYQYSMVNYLPQFPVTGGYSTPANFYTCKIKDDGDTWLLLADNSGCIRAFNDDGGTTSDGYSWGSASRITTNLTDISYGLLLANSSILINSNEFECDLYMGLQSATDIEHDFFPWSYYQPHFPWVKEDNSFLSGGTTSTGNCFAWSVGDTMSVFFYFTMNSWDTFYNNNGYTRVGATADNAAIALWGFNDSNMEHASVRKNSTQQNPHGFEWESRLGSGRHRIMHTRDALTNDTVDLNNYGRIQHYYRPIDGAVNYSLPVSSQILESSFLPSELNRIATLKNNLPAVVLSDFDTNYLIWKKTWDRPENAIHSNPFMYARSSEYENLREYCMKYGKAIWPLLFDKLAQKDIFVFSLLRDLTYTGKGNFGAEITYSASVKSPTLYTMQIDYCKGLLAKEDGNMLKSILDISASKEEPFAVTITVSNSREMQLSLYSEKDEKALVRVYNFLGGLEFDASYNISKGNQTFVINTSNFKKGIYVVQIAIGGESISKSISI